MSEKTNSSIKQKTLHNNWIKFLVCCFIFLLSFTYVTQNINNLFPLNYFESSQYASQVDDFLHWFYDIKIQLPQVSIPLDSIEVSKEEILDAKVNSNQYSNYLYNENTDEQISITSLSDEELKQLIQFSKYEKNQQLLQEYQNYNYSEKDAFYYQLTDTNGATYSNLPSDSVPTLNTIQIPYKGNNQDNFARVNNNSHNYGLTGTLYLPKASMGDSKILQSYQQYTNNKIFLVIGFTITMISLLPLYHYYKKIQSTSIQLPEQLKWIEAKYKTLPIEIKVILFIWTIILLQDYTVFGYWNIQYMFSHWLNTITKFASIFLLIYVFILQFKGLIYLLKNPSIIKKEWENGLYSTNIDDIRNLPIYRKVFTKVLMYTIFIGLWGIIIGTSIIDGFAFLLVGAISFVLALIVLLKIQRSCKTIQVINDSLDSMAQGKSTSDIHISGQGLIPDMAKNINIIREGFILSNQKQSNSERLKTELITNVSHDLRTPLTSILNYVDLAKRSDITAEERQEYLQIIDNKSKRLKVLIDDLFEASKMASGAVELYKEQVDLVALMHQSIAEYEDKFIEHQLILRSKTSAPQMYAYCDGRKMYRVFENLFGNIIKYAQSGTRVYLEMLYEGSEIVITLKNISNYELGFDIVELTERFKRGDSSRNTEGSGLGLAIVKSILDLHGATFELSQDGDLFKVTIKIKKL